jgi:hypothetical protein
MSFYTCFDWFKKVEVICQWMESKNRRRSHFFCYDIEKYIYFFKIRQIIGKNFNNPKGASFKENHLMTTAHNALRTTSISWWIMSYTIAFLFLISSEYYFLLYWYCSLWKSLDPQSFDPIISGFHLDIN